MDYQGKVTNVDLVFWYFELNNQFRVHMSIMIAESHRYELPELNTNVSIKNAHRYGSILVACPSSSITGRFFKNIHDPELINFVRTHHLGAADLIMLDKCIKMLEKNFKDVEMSMRHSFAFSLMLNAVKQSDIKIQKDHVCLNKGISHIEVVSVTSCRFVKIQPRSYPDFPYWSFGVNSKSSKNGMLFGLLEVQTPYGFFMLKDSSYQIACVVFNCTPNDLLKVANKYVLMKDYKVITEIYNADGVANLEYLIVDFEQIVEMVPTTQDTIRLIVGSGTNLNLTAYKYNVEFELKRKSSVLVGATKEPQYYLNVLITAINGVSTSEMAFLMFPVEYIPSLVFLQIDGVYKLHHKQLLQVTKCAELLRLANCKTYQISEKEAELQVLRSALRNESLMTVQECKSILQTKTDLLSFKGILKQKRFATSLPSRTVKRTKLYGFGTPGTRVNQLVFSYTNSSGREEYLDCYLNNWENILMPLGLIPEMELIVKNVTPQSRKYLKATILTTVEIVSHRPSLEFQTVNLYENEKIDWGPSSFLGQGNKLPFSAIIWGKVCKIQILSVRFSRKCKNCKLVKETQGPCTQCGETEDDVNFLSKLHATDIFGQSKILIKDIQCMKVFIGLHQNQSTVFFKALHEIGDYSFSLFDSETPTYSNNQRDSLRNMLTQYLYLFNRSALGDFELKCRKLDSNPLKNGGRPLWFLLDIRKSN